MAVKCFYHKSDLDGKCAGAIVKSMNRGAELYGVDYSDKRPTVEQGDVVYVVDFSFGIEDMKYLKETCNLIWIDHHKSSIEKMKGIRIPGIQKIGKAGCELTWEWFHGITSIPEAVCLLGRYDVWDHSDKRTLPFQYGMRQQEWYPDNENWKKLFNDGDFFQLILKEGQLLYNYQVAQNTMYAKGMAYGRLFHNYRAIVLNKPYANSQAFDSVYNPREHDIMVLWGCRENEYKYSIYTDKPEIDVSEIAKKYEGGGHRNAAGFYSSTRLL